jgi:hypothetical protein
MSCTASRGQAKHGGARINPDDRAARTDRVEEFGNVEAATTSNVQDPITRFGGDGLPDQASSAQRVTRPIQAFEPPRSLLVKRQLTHL